jgi:hypothetical protein
MSILDAYQVLSFHGLLILFAFAHDEIIICMCASEFLMKKKKKTHIPSIVDLYLNSLTKQGCGPG